jgi:CubicO group peptidase (beta-lactamase class C family)
MFTLQRLTVPTLLMICVAGAACPRQTLAQDAAHAQAAPVESLNALLDEVRTRSDVPGIAAAVVRDGKVIALGTSGVRELGQKDAIAPSDVFVVGSCTKAMTRVLLARLVDAGKLRFDATLGELLPDVSMREEYKKVTLAQVMSHHAGLQPYTRITPTDTPIFFELQGTPAEKRRQFLAHLLNEEPAAKPGTQFVYSNAGYSLLGAIVDRTGTTWEDAIAREVFTPLGMASARIGPPSKDSGVVIPKGHARTPKGYEPARRSMPLVGVLAPAGAVVLTIEDFAKFAAAQARLGAGQGAGLIRDETATKLPGLIAADTAGEEGQVFMGGQGTFTAGFATWPSVRAGVVVATNAGENDAGVQATVDALRAKYLPDAPVRGMGGPGQRRLGVSVRMLPDSDAITIESVAPGSIAERAGIKTGDEITSINGASVKGVTREEVGPKIREAGTKLTIRREGKTIEIVIPE